MTVKKFLKACLWLSLLALATFGMMWLGAAMGSGIWVVW